MKLHIPWVKNSTSEQKGQQKSDDVKTSRTMDRRQFLGFLGLGAVATAGVASGCSKLIDKEDRELYKIKMEEFFQKHYQVMAEEERQATIDRLERKAKLEDGKNVNIKTTPAPEGVLFGYALNISKCRGYRDCVKACRQENNLPEDGSMDYIRVHEIDKGSFEIDGEGTQYVHEVPQEEKFYLPMQCMHCENPPCVPVCPTKATWKEKDGTVVIDYNWCIGCRYCEAACPYWARRFNWKEPSVPAEKVNPDQHYLGNRKRMKGVMEKCHFCTHRTREGRQPACQEACPTGARIYGNLLDPNSEIRWILANKKVFRLKEELGTEPQFFYYMD